VFEVVVNTLVEGETKASCSSFDIFFIRKGGRGFVGVNSIGGGISALWPIKHLKSGGGVFEPEGLGFN